ETERLARELIGLGLQRVAAHDIADLYVLNTCTVTAKADADCRKLISRAMRTNKDAVVVVAGCYAVAERDRLTQLDGVSLVIGNEEKSRLSHILKDRFPHLFASPESTEDTGESSFIDSAYHRFDSDASPNELSINRPMVKIGDGCNQGCAYCIVPAVRGPLTSIPADNIVNEITRLVDAGYDEAVLTAVHIGKYDDSGLTLAGLVQKILDHTAIRRVRLSSLEPNELDDALLDLVAHNPRACRYLHLPLQSGSDRILRLMRRPYTRSEYLAVVEKVKKADSGITIGCDLIVSFPGETDADFDASLQVLDSGFIDYGHIFSYSDRPGTTAAALPGKLPLSVIKDRNRRAREISRANRRRQMDRQIGGILDVISEGRLQKGNFYWGVSDNYLKVKMPDNTGGGRRIVRFHPLTRKEDHLEGDIPI
ncbi:MAG: tRNA (N(6)-L-threonylcarbamoyladenosine(37)-C(2))-methylthiotransferase MtaB, partial [candidate division Zixibacteria bacterium]|nr:tRNA (N(6)-L-threonylcarbamoyladenosine(37)-C(2))-methylthiotransferase MtaB [candidate division Zixibacteria bacterium]